MSILFYILLSYSITLSTVERDCREIHRNARIIDGHNDLMMRVMAGDNVEVRSDKGHSDLARFKEAGYTGQVFSIWVDPKWDKKRKSFEYANRMIDSLEAICRRNPGRVRIVTNGTQLETSSKDGVLAAMIGLEGGHPIEESIEKLIRLYRRGVRYLGLTWNNSTGWATSSRDEITGKTNARGLTPFGRRVIRVMDSLGMLIDVSHSGEKTFWDVIKTTRNPVIASHSSVFRLRGHHRNLKDEQIRAIARTGGIVMINFYPPFIGDITGAGKEKRMEAQRGKLAAIERKYRKKPVLLRKAKEEFFASEAVRSLPSVVMVADHIDHVRKLVGVDHVGIGADYDGIGITPVGLEDVTKLPNLTEELCRRGYSETEIRKILGENFIRVFSRVCRE